MGKYRPVKIKCWIKFLKSKGCFYQSTEASHDKWKCPGCTRSIIHREKDKDIPPFHIDRNLLSMNIDKAVFWNWVEENC